MFADVLREVTDEMLKDYPSTYQINNGGCEDWANEVFYKLGNSGHIVEVWETPFGYADTTHVFIRIDGLFYDAECLEGVKDHMKLPLFSRLGQRQPVWRIEHNGKCIGESKLDISEEMKRRMEIEDFLERHTGPLETYKVFRFTLESVTGSVRQEEVLANNSNAAWVTIAERACRLQPTIKSIEMEI